MKCIELIKNLQTNGGRVSAGKVELNKLFDGENRTIVELRLGRGAVLARHHAAFPITVLCLSGHGNFCAGPELEDSQELWPGTLLTLEANVDHDVTAVDELHLIVSKFKPN